MRNEIILPDVEFGSRRANDLEDFTLPLNVYERDLLTLANKCFSSEKLEAMAVIKADDAFKIIRSRNSYLFTVLKDEEFSRILSSCDAYLDYLFLNDIESAYTTETDHNVVELMIKTLVSYFNNVSITQEREGRVVHISDGATVSVIRHALFFRPEDIRPSFNANFLAKVQRLMEKDVPSANSKNRIGIESIGTSLKNTPRPMMKVLESDPYIS